MRIAAPAKVNFGLAVLARRGDGYHELETVKAKISLADEVAVELNDSRHITIEVTFDDSLPAGSRAAPSNDHNICVRAAQAYFAAVTAPHGAHITLHKRIPSGAGLAGGSTDAAATLQALTALMQRDDNDGATMLRLAGSIGSDVPFLYSDYHIALARGRGERLRELPAPFPELHLVLVNPGFEISAAFAYEQLVGFSPRLKIADISERLAAGEDPRWPNALQPGVFRHHPELRGWQTALKNHGLRGALVSGSGPTVFGIANDSGHAAEVAEALRAAHPNLWVQTARTL